MNGGFRLDVVSESARPENIAPESALMKSRVAMLIALLCFWLAPVLVMADEVSNRIKNEVAAISEGRSIGGARIAGADFIKSFYAVREYRTAWHNTPAGEQLLREIEVSTRHGFRPEDFHAEELIALKATAEAGMPEDIAAFEIVATDAAVRLLHHLYFGKVDPERIDPDWNFGRPMVSGDPAAMLSEYVDADGYAVIVGDVSPKHPQYLELQNALEQYRALASSGGWPSIPSEPVLKPGEDDDRVPLLRERLAIEGYAPAAPSGTNTYDVALEEAVKKFQTRNGLEADGVLGAKTFSALNESAEERVDQIRLSLERARWIVRGLGDQFVLVNIAGAETYFARNGEIIWRTKSITGQAYRKTPVFRDEISYMEFNPTWTVPVSIFRRDKLPRIRKDPGYLARGGYTVRNRNGQTVDPTSVNWSSGNPGVTLVQKPGPKNALGTVKFMFPNKYAVYLHDTDDRSLFQRAERNLSSGCVRLADPYGFADVLMNGAPDWSAERREAILASGKTTRINLPEPVPVLLTYFTAWVADGEVQFRRDIYDRDAALLAALNDGFRQ